MAGGYDEWAAARTPSLLRFAHALTEDGPGAEAAVRTALARTRKAWPAVERGEHPDLLARRFVVDAAGARRRAAVVLRLLEDRSDAEIAEVLGASPAFVRSQVQRGLASAGDLLASAGGATTGLVQVRPPSPADEPAPPRRGRPVWVAALTVLGLVLTVSAVARATRTPAGEITYPAAHVPSDWRYESYAGVQVRVPATWGYGGAPFRADFSHGRLGACGANQAAVPSSADHATYVSSATPFVGRPAMMSDLCVSWGSDGVMPSADAVWLGSPLPVGVRAEGSEIAETRAVGGQRVTVFSDRPALRRQILATAEQVDVDGNGCPTQVVQQPSGAAQPRPSSLSVCVYSQDTGSPVLLWSGRVDGSAARQYADAVQHAGTAGVRCPGLPSGRWVALGLNGDRGTRWDVVDLGCGAIRSAGRAPAALTVATVRAWAHDGVPAYAPAPPRLPRALASYFRPTLG